MTDEELEDILDLNAVFEDPAAKATRELGVMAGKAKCCPKQETEGGQKAGQGITEEE